MEAWRQIQEFEGRYEVSSQGQVRSLDTLKHKKGRRRPKCPVKCLDNGQIYGSQRAAAKALGLLPGAVNNCVLGKVTHARGFHFEKIDRG